MTRSSMHDTMNETAALFMQMSEKDVIGTEDIATSMDDFSLFLIRTGAMRIKDRCVGTEYGEGTKETSISVTPSEIGVLNE